MNRDEWTFNVAVGFWRSPKAIAAGRDGRDVFLCAGAWASDKRTDGYVPADALPIIAAEVGITAAAAKKAAKKLVEVNMFEPADGGWNIHDFTDWNPTAEEREKKRAENAARQRRHRRVSNALRNGQDAGDSPVTDSECNGEESNRESTYTADASKSSSSDWGSRGDDDDPKRVTARAAIGLLAERDLADRCAAQRTNGQLKPVGDRRRWLDEAHERRWSANGHTALQLAAEHPEWGPDQVADGLRTAADPVPVPARGRCGICGSDTCRDAACLAEDEP